MGTNKHATLHEKIAIHKLLMEVLTVHEDRTVTYAENWNDVEVRKHLKIEQVYVVGNVRNALFGKLRKATPEPPKPNGIDHPVDLIKLKVEVAIMGQHLHELTEHANGIFLALGAETYKPSKSIEERLQLIRELDLYQ